MRIDGLGQAIHAAEAAAPKIRQLIEASKGVEAMFVKSLLVEMQKGTKLFGEGQGSSIYADLFNDAIAKQVAERGAFGIADLMVKQGTPKILAQARTQISNAAGATPAKSIDETSMPLKP